MEEEIPRIEDNGMNVKVQDLSKEDNNPPIKLGIISDISKLPTRKKIQKYLEEREELLREEDSTSLNIIYANNIRQLDKLNLHLLNALNITNEEDGNLSIGLNNISAESNHQNLSGIEPEASPITKCYIHEGGLIENEKIGEEDNSYYDQTKIIVHSYGDEENMRNTIYVPKLSNIYVYI